MNASDIIEAIRLTLEENAHLADAGSATNRKHITLELGRAKVGLSEVLGHF